MTNLPHPHTPQPQNRKPSRRPPAYLSPYLTFIITNLRPLQLTLDDPIFPPCSPEYHHHPTCMPPPFATAIMQPRGPSNDTMNASLPHFTYSPHYFTFDVRAHAQSKNPDRTVRPLAPSRPTPHHRTRTINQLHHLTSPEVY